MTGKQRRFRNAIFENLTKDDGLLKNLFLSQKPKHKRVEFFVLY